MFKYLLPLLFCICVPSNADNKKVEILQKSEQLIYQSILECHDELSVGSFQDCNLKLSYLNKSVKNLEIFINGGMPDHQHGLPTSPKITWSDEKGRYTIKGLKFSMPGSWELKFKINHHDENLKDLVTMKIQVKG